METFLIETAQSITHRHTHTHNKFQRRLVHLLWLLLGFLQLLHQEMNCWYGCLRLRCDPLSLGVEPSDMAHQWETFYFQYLARKKPVQTRHRETKLYRCYEGEHNTDWTYMVKSCTNLTHIDKSCTDLTHTQTNPVQTWHTYRQILYKLDTHRRILYRPDTHINKSCADLTHT